MEFALAYEQTIHKPQDPNPLFYKMRLTAKGEVFYLERELVVFHESAQSGSRPLYAAALSDLHYIQRQDTTDVGPGFVIRGTFPSGDKIELWAGTAQTFYCEQGYAVFYERSDRTGKQILAVRCSSVREIEWQAQKAAAD
jgi:hypothetical protein